MIYMETEKKEIFSEEEIKSLAGFFEALHRVHCRLIGEGWKMVEGEMMPPPDYKPKNRI